MRRTLLINISALLAVLMIWAQPKAAAIAQGGDVILRPDPLSLGLTPDARARVAIVLENVEDLYGLEFHLAFDPNVAE